MASYVVDGLVLPVRVGGHPALDFCNTRAGWGAAEKEYLHTYAHLARWTQECGLLAAADQTRLLRSARREPDRAADVVARAVALRSSLYAVLAEPDHSAAWVLVADEVRAAASTATLVPVPGPALAEWRLAAGLELPLSVVAWSAAELLTSPAARAVRACPGQGCGWVFADPRGRRRWCSMAWCGNRAKARRHAERRRDG